MARRPTSRSRIRTPRRPVGVEWLEPRQVLASLVAVGSDIGATSQPFIKLVNAETGAVVAQTLAFESAFRGGVQAVMGDVDANGTQEIIAFSGPGRVAEVRVFEQVISGSTTTLSELTAYRTQPFGPNNRFGVSGAVGDVDGDNRADLITIASRGPGLVNVFRSIAATDPVSDVPYRSFTAFSPTFNGGGSVAAIDLGTYSAGVRTSSTPDGKVEIAVGGGGGLVPIVKVYDVSSAPAVVAQVRPFTAGQIGGVTVSAGRYDGDATEDLVIAGRRGFGGLVEIYSGAAPATRLARFNAFAGLARPNAPVSIAGIDRNGDGRIDGFAATQGDPGGTYGMLELGQAGNRIGSFTTVAGPLAVGAPRTPYTFVTTPSGLQYRNITLGTGPVPTAGQTIQAHYTGWLVNGTKFDSSRDRGTPFSFTLGAGQVIAGWDEAFASMPVGTRSTLVIPANLAYGSSSRTGIPANSTLVFDVELLSTT